MVAQHVEAAGTPGVMVQTGGGGGDNSFWKKDKAGNIAKVVVAPEEHGQAPKQGFYILRLIGISDIFDVNGDFGKAKGVRLEYVINVPGTSEHKKKFDDMASVMKWGEQSQSFYWNLGSQSKMGRMIEAITGQPIAPNSSINLADYLGGEFQALVKSTTGPDKKGVVRTKATVAYDTIGPVETAGPAGPDQYAPAPEPVAAASNPFLADDL